MSVTIQSNHGCCIDISSMEAICSSMKHQLTCRNCGEDFERDATVGRPPAYCSPQCRKAACNDAKRSRYVKKKDPRPVHECPLCGNAFVIKRPGQRFCSPLCAKRSTGQSRRVVREAKKCCSCRQPYQPRPDRRKHFCSRECCFASLKKGRWMRGFCREFVQKNGGLIWRQPERVVYWCLGCGVDFTPKGSEQFCSDSCQSQHESRTCKKCRSCGCSMPKDLRNNARYCSERCRKVVQRKHRRLANKRRRFRERSNAMQELYNPFDIFRRDSWICGICFKPTDPAAFYPDPQSATIDHIVPVSRGGPDTAANVQCAHALCNSIKGDSLDFRMDA